MYYDFLTTTSELEECVADKRIVCFGAGYRAIEFLSEHPRILERVVYFLDNNSNKRMISMGNRTFPVKPFDSGCNELTGSDVLVITTSVRFLTEMVEQLAQIKLSDSITCFASTTIDLCDIMNGVKLKHSITRISEFIASREVSKLCDINAGELTQKINRQFEILEFRTREYYSNCFKKGDPKAFFMLEENLDVLCSSVKNCHYLLIMDTVNTFHHGCSANSLAVRIMLSRSGGVFSVGYGTLMLNPVVYPVSMNEFTSEQFKEKWEISNSKLIARMKACEHIVFNGETLLDFFSSISVNLYYLLYYAKTSLKKKVSIINHSVSPVSYINCWHCQDHTFFIEMLKLLYEQIDNCYLRESVSLRELDEFIPGIGKQAFDCVPLYISEVFNQINVSKSEGNYILITGGNNLPAWYSDFLLAILDNQIIRTIPIHFMVSDLPYHDIEYDYAELDIYECLKKKFNGRVSLVTPQSTDEWLDKIRSASLLISGRYHHSISAFMFDTPFMVFKANTRKIYGMLEMIGKLSVLLPEDDIHSALSYAITLLESSSFSKPNDPEVKIKVLQLAEMNFALE